MRAVVSLLSVLATLASCATPGPEPSPNGPWHYVDQVPGCLRFVGDRGDNAQRTIVLEDAFRVALISKLPDGSVPSPHCWYERPNGSVLLQAGDYCRNPHWVTFVRANSEWQVAKIEDPFMSCHPKAGS